MGPKFLQLLLYGFGILGKCLIQRIGMGYKGQEIILLLYFYFVWSLNSYSQAILLLWPPK
jgi:hypothetical protein